ncbi:uncharacterized protein LOC120691054 isoform X2 [Panicum virgatum]|uniref:uncharacterized protein LOC120691054 isoform X2 n=1 Tax=Panicum virgatum TaxID=38727 RepID=UPI0019D5B4B7|nr:uncharacterized protein LOC120691054 isoform X2 [Panicum virgatum]
MWVLLSFFLVVQICISLFRSRTQTMVAACARLNHMIELVGTPDSAWCDSPACHAHAAWSSFVPFNIHIYSIHKITWSGGNLLLAY